MPRSSILSAPRPRMGARFSALFELTKPRLSALSVLTGLAGFFCAPRFEITPAFYWMISGAAACAGGVAALNQWLESDTDAIMLRTASRPIPSGRIAPGSAFVLGWTLCLAGLAVLFANVNGLAAFFALATIITYVGLYTPAKRSSRFSTELGAVAGALPPLIGWAANEHRTVPLAWILFGILLLWQIPHFMAIAWVHRDDYKRASFPMLAVRDASGGRVAAYALVCTIALVAVGALPFFIAKSSAAYLLTTLVLGGFFITRAVAFLTSAPREPAARRLFFASLFWLPLQLTALALL